MAAVVVEAASDGDGPDGSTDGGVGALEEGREGSHGGGLGGCRHQASYHEDGIGGGTCDGDGTMLVVWRFRRRRLATKPA